MNRNSERASSEPANPDTLDTRHYSENLALIPTSQFYEACSLICDYHYLTAELVGLLTFSVVPAGSTRMETRAFGFDSDSCYLTGALANCQRHTREMPQVVNFVVIYPVCVITAAACA